MMQWRLSRVLYFAIEWLMVDEGLRDLRGMTVYTVGPATALAITKLQFSTIVGADTGNGAALSNLIVQTFHRDESGTDTPTEFPPRLPLLFLVGDKRRDIIHKRLAVENIPLEELTVYETTIASTFDEELDRVLEDDTDGEIEWIIFFSPSGAEIALEKLKRLPQKVKVGTIGPTTEEYLRKEWDLIPDMVSAKPEPLSMVQGILDRS
jgi:uroporphyrinogen-III synthase